MSKKRLNACTLMLWIHGVATVVFVILIPISLMTGLKDSVPYLVFLSLWALVAGHAAGYQGVRAEIQAGKKESEKE